MIHYIDLILSSFTANKIHKMIAESYTKTECSGAAIVASSNVQSIDPVAKA